MIGSFDVAVVDCPDPQALVRFYQQLVGGEITEDDARWSELNPEGAATSIGFQHVEGYRAPECPGQEVPQQIHFDVYVDSLDEGERQVLAIGASATGSGTDSYRVFLDPAGHPFCLCLRSPSS